MLVVVTGLVPVTSLRKALCVSKRDGRDKPGHDSVRMPLRARPSPSAGEGKEAQFNFDTLALIVFDGASRTVLQAGGKSDIIKGCAGLPGFANFGCSTRSENQ